MRDDGALIQTEQIVPLQLPYGQLQSPKNDQNINHKAIHNHKDIIFTETKTQINYINRIGLIILFFDVDYFKDGLSSFYYLI